MYCKKYPLIIVLSKPYFSTAIKQSFEKVLPLPYLFHLVSTSQTFYAKLLCLQITNTQKWHSSLFSLGTSSWNVSKIDPWIYHFHFKDKLFTLLKDFCNSYCINYMQNQTLSDMYIKGKIFGRNYIWSY